MTDAAGVRIGYWGWASTFQDFDNDGDLDLFHVNGFGRPDIPETAEFVADPSVFFVNDGAGAFTEQAAALGVADTDEGRGVSAFDYDRDGDLDLFVHNSEGPGRLYRNDGGNAARWLDVVLHGRAPNTEGIGARIRVTADGTSQIRELRAGSNYVSQIPPRRTSGWAARRTSRWRWCGPTARAPCATGWRRTSASHSTSPRRASTSRRSSSVIASSRSTRPAPRSGS